ncbi:MAG: hypothetical protein WCZ89_00115 [Phycisphaerae bacterium]
MYQKSLKSKLFLAVIFIFYILIFGCSKKNVGSETKAIQDKPLFDFQSQLLEIAFETAGSIPVNPYIKDRSKAQELVVLTCLELDQPQRASLYIEKIEDWRKGVCYAELADYYVKHNFPKEAERYLELAQNVAEQDHRQTWRNNRITAKIARVKRNLGKSQQMENPAEDMAQEQINQTAEVNEVTKTGLSFEEQVKALEELIRTGNFEVAKNLLFVYAQLYDRYYGNLEKRSLIEENIKNSYVKVPVFIQVDLLVVLAESALRHSDKSQTIAFINEAQQLIESQQLTLEYRTPMMAKLIKLHFRADDIEKAWVDLQEELDLFNSQKYLLTDITRAKALRPIAELYQFMGDTQGSLSIYKQVIEEGVQNPNTRPRAEDLSATCCSMAFYAVEPDAQLWIRIKQIIGELGHPW